MYDGVQIPMCNCREFLPFVAAMALASHNHDALCQPESARSSDEYLEHCHSTYKSSSTGVALLLPPTSESISVTLQPPPCILDQLLLPSWQ